MSEDADPYAGLDETTAYRTKVMHGVMSTVVDAGAIEGSGGGLVNLDCGSAWKKDPGSGVIGVEKRPLIPLV